MYDRGLQKIIERLAHTLEQDALVQKTTDKLRKNLSVDRVVLYYFYSQWKGRVTFESLKSQDFSIFGETGPDECFNHEYAAMYEAGRVRAIPDIETELINPCHREFLRTVQVRANLVVPILTAKGLWGLMIAHQCQNAHFWSPQDVQLMKEGAEILANASSIRGD